MIDGVCMKATLLGGPCDGLIRDVAAPGGFPVERLRFPSGYRAFVHSVVAGMNFASHYYRVRLIDGVPETKSDRVVYDYVGVE